MDSKIIKKSKIINSLIYGLELIIVVTILVLEYLSSFKAGVMRHLYSKKIEYLAKIYTEKGMMIHTIIIVFLFVTLAFVFKNSLSKKRKLNFIRFLLYVIILISGFYLPYMKDLNTYVYILIFLEIFIGIEAMKLLLEKIKPQL
ncbi:hypothetical protein [Clostridium grantii]|uniref:Uncharacterized protein n=1 Tax=Clostridium grantii DSM 8605 TaxID=1121316 RepID=A0A1M5T5E8_9CLOT|nr:hypothetical protein [Clostridium grantii]SHH45987.1 hypothetical protein SAMN02745207_01212 [Clostridium grantii DSM 8605]